MKYGAPGGTITLTLERTERQARFDVIEIRGAKLTHIKDAFPYRGPMF